jgi:DNA topoisomerase I
MAKRKHLVIVESPAKARTIGRYLGADYDVAASVGHVRDLPDKELGVDIENGFEPVYVTIRGKSKVIADLKQKARTAENVILATDPDREGEAIAWHVAEQLGYRGPQDSNRFQRVRFHEITRGAIREALDHAGPIDMNRVEAQQARRILDRLVGYQASPLLWKPIRPGLSAGRVQTVALRLICEREDEIRAFNEEEYWSITAHLERDQQLFDARLHHVDGKAFTLSNEADATSVVTDVQGVPFTVTEVKRRERKKSPQAPFTTSTLQQEAAKRLRFSARRTMSVAQRLYEGVDLGERGAVGLITYMRTDSTRVSASAAMSAREWVADQIGASYLPEAPRLWGGKQQKGAQEAHEGIRPTDPHIHPAEASRYLEPDEARLYELVWLRFVSSQMADAIYDTTTVDFDLRGISGRSYLYRATGSVVKFEGFTRLYIEAKEAGDHRRLDDLEPLPDLSEGLTCDVRAIEPKQHFTQPPPRFSEASLVRELERLGIGRPSTYAQIISTIQDRGYCELDQGRFKPTDLGETVAKLLVRVLPNIFDVQFTSRMERELDQVEEGDVAWRQLLEGFYPPFREQLERGKTNSDEIIKEILAAEGERCDVCGRPMLVRWNRFGRFLGCSGYPECQSTRPLRGANVPEGPIAQDSAGKSIFAKVGPYGPYLEVGDGEADGKPKRVSLPTGKTLETLTPEYAQKLVGLPRPLGKDPATGEEVVAGLGRFGPFVKLGKTYASIQGTEDHVFDIELAEALQLIALKQAGKPIIKEIGPHPETGEAVNVYEGRYGPYVSDGSVNASLPKDADPTAIDMDEALDLLSKAAKRKGGGRGRFGRKSGPPARRGGKSAPKAATPKKSAKKSTKKASAKKSTGRKAKGAAPPDADES